MVNNGLGQEFRLGAALGFLGLLGLGCHGARAAGDAGYQGVAELDERRLAFEVAGRLVSLAAREGDRIAQGQAIARLDGALDAQVRVASDLEAHAAQAQSTLLERGTRVEEIAVTRARLRAARSAEVLAQRSLERDRALFESGAVARANLDETENAAERAAAEREALESELTEQERGARPEERQAAKARAEAARASVDLDELRLDLRELRAPFDAEVLEVLVEPGEVVMAGAPVLLVADPAHPFAEVFVPQAELAGMQVGARASLKSDSLAEPLIGRVEHVARTTEFTPRYLFSERERPNLVVRVKVRIDDPERRLHAGVPVFVNIDRGAPSGAVP